MLKLRKKPTFTRVVDIYQLSADRPNGRESSKLTVEYRRLNSDELSQLNDRQKNLKDDGLALDSLAEAVDTVVVEVKGLGDEEGQEITGDDAIQALKDYYDIGKQVIAHYWEVTNDPKNARAKN